MPKTVKLKM